jgi:hypothetical protein
MVICGPVVGRANSGTSSDSPLATVTRSECSAFHASYSLARGDAWSGPERRRGCLPPCRSGVPHGCRVWEHTVAVNTRP